MKKFRINELSTSNDSSNGGHHGMRSPSSLSLASSSTSINQASDRLSLANNVVHSSEPQRATPFYQTENNLISSHNDNINWRDEADGSEEEECRPNAVSSTADLQSANLQSNLFGQHSNLLTHQAPIFTNMVEQDLRSQALNNTTESVRINVSKNLEPNKEKQLRETELYIDRIEDLLVSFKNLLKSGESVQHNCGIEDNINNNINSSNSRKTSQAASKMTNNSNLLNYSRVSNHFAQNTTIPKNTHQVNESAEDNMRNNKNRKLSNNRHFIQTDFQPHLNNNHNVAEDDLVINETLSNENHCVPEDKIDQFYRLINIQVNTLRKRLEQISTTSDIKDSVSQNNLPNDGFNILNQNSFNEFSLCDIDNCCVPSELHPNVPDDSFITHFRTYNQQIYQLLMFQNNQINQQHQLIQCWMNGQQKLLDKLSRNPIKFTLNHHQNNLQANSSNSANNLYFNDIAPMNHHHLNNKQNFIYPSEMTLNNQTEPRTRANNFLDNFRSHSFQNKLQTNRDTIPCPRDVYTTNHTNHQTSNNCSNSCINIGPCNKNSRSQSFAGFSSSNPKPQSNNFVLNQAGIQTANYNTNGNSNNVPYLIEKKLNNNVDNNIQQINKLLSTLNKIGEPEPVSSAFNSNIQYPFSASKVNVANSRLNFPPYSLITLDSKNSCKRKKTSNMNNVDEEDLHENVGEFDNEDDDHDSVDLEEPSPFDQVLRTNGNPSELNMLNFPSAIVNPIAPTALPSFHMDKCNFQVPLTISPHTGAIRKKPIYDCNFKFSATDNQKLSMQHHPKDKVDNSNPTHTNSNSNPIISHENVRPLMPAEGRSSEQLLSNNSNAVTNVVLKTKLSKSSRKYSTRPPITGAGNDSTSSNHSYASNSLSSQDSMTNSLDDDIKWNKLNGDMQNNTSPDKIPSKGNDQEGQEQKNNLPCNGNALVGDNLENINGTDLSPTTPPDDQRLLDGSTDSEMSHSLAMKETCLTGESSFNLPVNGGAHLNQSSSIACSSSSLISLTGNNTAINKSLSSGEMEAAQHNGGDNGLNTVNGRFLPDEVIRVNGHNMVHDDDDDDLDEDKDTDVRLLSLAGNAVEVRSTVRLSGDGEQGL